MYVAHLSLTDFRSYAQVELPLEPGITALVGPNGQGKTNLVEALGYVATLGSHRVPTDAALVRSGASRAVVRARVIRERDAGQPRPTLVEVEVTPGKANRARVNGGSPTRARDILGILRTVLFAPEDLALVKGDPDGRRRFLDDLLVQLTPRIAGVVADYDRVLRQRSALLKSAGAAMRGGRSGADLRTLDVWDTKLAQTGAQIIVARRSLVRALAPHVEKAYAQVSSGQGDAVTTYKASLDAALGNDSGSVGETAGIDDGAGVELVEAQLLEAVGRLRTKEIERGVSLVGPHRDDLVLKLGGLPAKGYASHGESWSFALALRLASYELLTNGFDDAGDWGPDGEPVLVLDDVFAELDGRRRERLAELVAPARQVLITAAVPGDVPELLAGARVDVMAGEVSRVL
ncbi:DNA replication/repair protein RecF [Cellulomonas sp. URHE0023]|uniref:DNA replication/repair protein RecF n=1 Tax=Cellulomonas sp. URHE0023 TaxID=1380354 RepID=UPI00048A016C|nr:DNA replication/repair protein RecF [Cellulomonas sp. URHE0023]